MSTGQIFLYLIIGFIIFSYIRKILNNRKVEHHNPAELSRRIKNQNNMILLDVRTDPERRKGHIKGSVHIPLNQLRKREQELEKYKNKEIVCYCASGNRSINAAIFLQKHGFNASNLKGGISAWNYQNQK